MSQFSDDIQAQFDSISDQFDADEQNFSDYASQNDDNITDLQNNTTDLQNNSGQLTFPLNQDTQDLINQQAFAIIGYLVQQNYISSAALVAGTVTISNPNVSATSLVLLSVSTKGGTQGILSYVATAGSLVITSTSSTDTSTVIYFVLS